MSGKPFPQAVDAERSLLGGLILKPGRIPEIQAILDAKDFYRPEHGALFAFLVERFKRGETIDLVTLSQALLATGEAGVYGGIAYVVELPDHIPSTVNLPHYADVIAKNAAFSQFLGKMEEWKGDALLAGDPLQLFNRVASDLQSFKRPGAHSAVWLGEALDDHMDRADQMHRGDVPVGVPTGFRDLDEKLGGGPAGGNLVVLAARPAMGKTALALNLLLRAANEHENTVGIFSLEMGRVELLDRLLSTYTGIELSTIRNPRMWTQDEWDKIMTARDELAKLRILMDTRSRLQVSEIRAEATRWKLQHDVGLIVIDYLGLIPTPLGLRTEATGNNCLELKGLAKDLDIPIILVHQLNRGVEGRQDKTPIPSDLKDSGDIEQHADVILFVYRPHQYDSSEPRRLAWLILSKNRQGPTGRIELEWYGEVQLFRDCSTLEERRKSLAERNASRGPDGKSKAAGAGQGQDRKPRSKVWTQKSFLPG